jgi:UDP-glucose 4-epimerase
LLPLVLDAAAGKRPPVKVFGLDYPTPDGTCVRDYVHVVDVARAHLAALPRLDDIGLDVFNIGSETGFTVRQVIDTVGMVLGRPVPWEPAPRRAGDPAVLVASARRARERLGWAPQYSALETIVESAWRWRERHPKGYAA